MANKTYDKLYHFRSQDPVCSYKTNDNNKILADGIDAQSSQVVVYEENKKIFQEGKNITLNKDDNNQTLTISSVEFIPKFPSTLTNTTPTNKEFKEFYDKNVKVAGENFYAYVNIVSGKYILSTVFSDRIEGVYSNFINNSGTKELSSIGFKWLYSNNPTKETDKMVVEQYNTKPPIVKKYFKSPLKGSFNDTIVAYNTKISIIGVYIYNRTHPFSLMPVADDSEKYQNDLGDSLTITNVAGSYQINFHVGKGNPAETSLMIRYYNF